MSSDDGLGLVSAFFAVLLSSIACVGVYSIRVPLGLHALTNTNSGRMRIPNSVFIGAVPNDTNTIASGAVKPCRVRMRFSRRSYAIFNPVVELMIVKTAASGTRSRYATY